MSSGIVPQSMEEVLSAATLMFPNEVIQRMRDAQFCMDDIYDLTRDDIDQEFKGIRFGLRKSLWQYFQALKPTNAIKDERQSTSSIISNDVEEEITDVENPTGIIVLSPEPTVNICDDKVPLRRGLSKRKRFRDKSKDFASSYPDGISSPFPLNMKLKEYLRHCSDAHTMEYRTEYRHLIREIYQKVEMLVGRVPTVDELNAVARNLCLEYPCLMQENEHMALYESLRKRKNSVGRGRNNASLKEDLLQNGSQVEEYEPVVIRKPQAYPDHFPFPFPLAAPIKRILRSGVSLSQSTNIRSYARVVKEVGSTLSSLLDTEKANLSIVEAVALSLCGQYPILCQHSVNKPPYHAFFVKVKSFMQGTQKVKARKLKNIYSSEALDSSHHQTHREQEPSDKKTSKKVLDSS